MIEKKKNVLDNECRICQKDQKGSSIGENVEKKKISHKHDLHSQCNALEKDAPFYVISAQIINEKNILCVFAPELVGQWNIFSNFVHISDFSKF